jgi:hypothetical protein
MPHTYRYGNAEGTLVVRDDGAWVEIETNRDLQDCAGHFVEQWRLDGGRAVVAPFVPAFSAETVRLMAGEAPRGPSSTRAKARKKVRARKKPDALSEVRKARTRARKHLAKKK